MLYVAGQGQTLYDNSCKFAFHGHNAQFEFHIPAFVCYSDGYQGRYPGKVAQLGCNRSARLATENMFRTLLDLGDIRYATERLEWRFLDQRFRQHKRLSTVTAGPTTTTPPSRATAAK